MIYDKQFTGFSKIIPPLDAKRMENIGLSI